MTPTQELVHEHDAALAGLELLDRIADGFDAGEASAPEHLEQLLDFFAVFVDRCHHGKEEDVLFPELEGLGVPRTGGPIGVMLAEHELGRGHIRAMREALTRFRGGDASAAGTFRDASRAYIGLLTAHIQKENEVLFPMADRLLSTELAASVSARFAQIEHDRIGEGRHEAYHAMLHELGEQYHVAHAAE